MEKVLRLLQGGKAEPVIKLAKIYCGGGSREHSVQTRTSEVSQHFAVLKHIFKHRRTGKQAGRREKDHKRRKGKAKVTGRRVKNVRGGRGGLQRDRECDITSHLVRGSCLDWPETPPVSAAQGSLINHCVKQYI